MSKVFIVSGCRTPVGNFQGQFEKYPASLLGTIVISEAIARANLKPADVDQVIMGQTLTAGQGQNPARQAALNAQIPNTSTAFTINMLCGSGLKTIALGCQAIKSKDCGIVVAGGQESMTRAEHTTYLRGTRQGNLNLKDSLLHDGLTDAFHSCHMGMTTEHVVKLYNISRKEQDEFAIVSQRKAEHAIKSGYFDKEIVGVEDKRTKNIIKTDEFPKFGITIEELEKLMPAFDKTGNGTVTRGNASGMNDGAAAVVLAGEVQVASKKLKPLAEVVAFAEAGNEPMCMGIGPIPAVKKVLEKAGWSRDDVDLYELNEAYAAQSIIVQKELGVPDAKVNVCGGALALGHPVGCSGTKILVTLLYSLIRLNKKKGVAALCVGGGMGVAIAIEIC